MKGQPIVAVRLDDSMHAKLVAFAAREKISITEALRHCVMHACKNTNPEIKILDEYKAEVRTVLSGLGLTRKGIMKRYMALGINIDTLKLIWEEISQEV